MELFIWTSPTNGLIAYYGFKPISTVMIPKTIYAIDLILLQQYLIQYKKRGFGVYFQGQTGIG